MGDVREINVKELFWYTICKWRFIFLVSLIFVIISFAFGYFYKEYIIENTIELDKEENIPLTLEEISLTNYEKQAYEIYCKYDVMYKDFYDVFQSDELMSNKDDDLYYGRNIYWINGSNDNEIITYIYRDKISSREDLLGAYEDLDVIDVYAMDQFVEDQGSRDRLTALRVTVFGGTEKEIQDILDVVDKYIFGEKENISEDVSEFDIKLISHDIHKAEASVLRTYKENQRSVMWGYYTARKSAYDGMPDNVKEYITALSRIEDNDGIDPIAEEKKEQEEKSNGTLPVITHKIRPVFGMFGLLIGIIVSVVVLIFKYILNDKITFEDDFEDMYKIDVLGRVVKEKTYKGLDKLLVSGKRRKMRLFTQDDTIDMIVSNIKIYANKNNISRIFATGAYMSDREKNIMNKVSEILSKSNIDIVIGKPMLYYTEALEQSSDFGKVVLVEKAGMARYDEIEREFKECSSKGIDILGVVIVE